MRERAARQRGSRWVGAPKGRARRGRSASSIARPKSTKRCPAFFARDCTHACSRAVSLRFSCLSRCSARVGRAMCSPFRQSACVQGGCRGKLPAPTARRLRYRKRHLATLDLQLSDFVSHFARLIVIQIKRMTTRYTAVPNIPPARLSYPTYTLRMASRSACRSCEVTHASSTRKSGPRNSVSRALVHDRDVHGV